MHFLTGIHYFPTVFACDSNRSGARTNPARFCPSPGSQVIHKAGDFRNAAQLAANYALLRPPTGAINLCRVLNP